MEIPPVSRSSSAHSFEESQGVNKILVNIYQDLNQLKQMFSENFYPSQGPSGNGPSGSGPSMMPIEPVGPSGNGPSNGGGPSISQTKEGFQPYSIDLTDIESQIEEAKKITTNSTLIENLNEVNRNVKDLASGNTLDPLQLVTTSLDLLKKWI